MKFARYRIECGVVVRPRKDEIARRRPQDDGGNLIAFFDRCHQPRSVAKLFARSKSVEQAEYQTVLSFALQEKRLNACQELPRIREELYLVGRNHNAETVFRDRSGGKFHLPYLRITSVKRSCGIASTR